MRTAYTPGLTVSHDHGVLKKRRLPIAGEVLVDVGQAVEYSDVVARAELSGDIETIRLADRMQLDPDELEGKLIVEVGEEVKKGQLLAESPGIFGFFKSEVRSSVEGTVEYFTAATGPLGIRKPPIHIEAKAYVSGQVVELEEAQGVTVRTRGALIQGIFGVGGERHGEIQVVADSPDSLLKVSELSGDLQGKILVGGAHVDLEGLRAAADAGVVGVVVGGVHDSDLAEFLGYDIGVAITGDEDIPFTLILTEGFGQIHMANRTFELLKSLEGSFASFNGATQIRAGAMRPEIIVPHSNQEKRDAGPDTPADAAKGQALAIGTTVRAVRQPHFGEIGTVTELPSEPVRVASGAVVRILKMKMENDLEVALPRANVEIIEDD